MNDQLARLRRRRAAVRNVAEHVSADISIPMIAPADLGRAAAERLLAPVGDTARHFLEGPERYMPQDVADAFASALARDVFVQVAAREQWPTVYEQAGFVAEGVLREALRTPDGWADATIMAVLAPDRAAGRP